MLSLDDIRNEAKTLPNPEIREVCFRLIDGLAKRAEDQGKMWTFKSLSRLVGREPSDPLLQFCVQLLVTRPRAKLLDIHFLFFNPEAPDDSGEPIADEDVAAAYAHGYLVEPVSGEEIRDFEHTLVPYFSISEGLLAHGSNS